MKDKKVSIIVPIYNAEAKLVTCLDSILCQTYQNIEVILINDGSTDNSGLICDAYAANTEQVHVIHQQNAGPSAARNKGIKKATGYYMQFVDADDSIHENMTEEMVKAANGELVICGYQTTSPYEQKGYFPSITGNYTFNELLKQIGLLFKEIILPSPCNKLYRLENIRKYGLAFKETFHLGEDLLFNLDYIATCSTINIITKPLYYYRIHQQHSLTSAYQKDFWKQQKVLLECVTNFLEKNHCNSGANYYYMQLIYLQTCINSMDYLFHNQSQLTPLERLKEMKLLLNDFQLDENIHYRSSYQNELVKLLLKNKSAYSLYLVFQLKSKLRHTPLFLILKKSLGMSKTMK